MRAYRTRHFFVTFHWIKYGIKDDKPFKIDTLGSQVVRSCGRKAVLSRNDLDRMAEFLQESLEADHLEIISFQKL